MWQYKAIWVMKKFRREWLLKPDILCLIAYLHQDIHNTSHTLFVYNKLHTPVVYNTLHTQFVNNTLHKLVVYNTWHTLDVLLYD